MNNYLKDTFYAQPDYDVFVACSQCLRYATCLHLEHIGLTREELKKQYGRYDG